MMRKLLPKVGEIWIKTKAMNELLYFGNISLRPLEPEDIDLLYSVARQIPGTPLCPLGDFAVPAVISSIERFRPDYEALVRS